MGKTPKYSANTALREMQGVSTKKILKREEGGGKTTNYVLKE
jgi:hypothetical protein